MQRNGVWWTPFDTEWKNAAHPMDKMTNWCIGGCWFTLTPVSMCPLFFRGWVGVVCASQFPCVCVFFMGALPPLGSICPLFSLSWSLPSPLPLPLQSFIPHSSLKWEECEHRLIPLYPYFSPLSNCSIFKCLIHVIDPPHLRATHLSLQLLTAHVRQSNPSTSFCK